MRLRVQPAALMILISMTLASCGVKKLVDAIKDANNGDDGSTTTTTPQATVTLQLTDAPADSATKAVVEFAGVELTPDSGQPVAVPFNPARSFDLLTLRNDTTVSLLANQTVPAGRYTQIRLVVNAIPSSQGHSFVETSAGGHFPLVIPAGADSGLTIRQPFTLSTNGHINLVVDFDLRKSLIAPTSSGDFTFKPSVRMVDEAQDGVLTGTVAATNTCNFIYLFSGANATLRDMNADGGGPYVSTRAAQSSDGAQTYRISFLPAGDYRVSLVCGQNDTPEASEPLFDPAKFPSRTVAATITAGRVTTVNF